MSQARPPPRMKEGSVVLDLEMRANTERVLVETNED